MLRAFPFHVTAILARVRRPDPMVFMIIALLCAAAIVVYLQHRALAALDRQTTVILQKVAEQTLAEAALEIRRTFDGPVFDTLAGVNHPLLVAHRLDLVARQFERGLEAYPQVQRFYAWLGQPDSGRGEEVLFLGGASRQAATAPGPDDTPAMWPGRARPDRRSLGGAPPGPDDSRLRFHRDPRLGELILAEARRHARTQKIYMAVPVQVAGRSYDVFIRVFYTDASRTRYFAVLGFLVDLDDVRSRLFPALFAGRLRPLLQPSDGSPPFDLRVLDEAGRLVAGPPDPGSKVSSSVPLVLQFYPVDDIGPRVAATIPARRWTLAISPRLAAASGLLASTRTQSYWLSGLSLLLMFVALAFAQQVRQRAAQLARMQAEFVAHVSHQLKTPVSLLSAVGETMALDRVRSPDKLAQCVDIVRSETSRLSALVEHILDFSRANDPARRFEMEEVALGPLVRETVESFARGAAAAGFRIDVEEAGPTPTVAADPAALEQALVNLLDNARKYSGPARAITVRVGTLGSDAVIEVVDRGIGIPAAERSRIFERFYRGTGAAVERQGFGLGLPIALELVTGQRGTIEVQSEEGAGSTFRIRLPVLQRAERPGLDTSARGPWRGSVPAWARIWRARGKWHEAR
jgi:two-component system phosphate regulon sensor histidine kinase PhoR